MMIKSRQKLTALFTFILLCLAALTAGSPALAGPVNWPLNGKFRNPLVIMYTTNATQPSDMMAYTKVDFYVLLPTNSQGVALEVNGVLNPAAVHLQAEMHIRGQSTLGSAKNQFAVKLLEDWPEGQANGHFMGMKHGGKHWVFNAPGFVDPTMIRNVMAFDMQRILGNNTGSNAWAPRTKYFEFFAVFNQDGSTPLTVANIKAGYMGAYINFEHIRAEDHRVPISGDYKPVQDGAVGGLLVQLNNEDASEKQLLLDANLAGNSDPAYLQWPELDFFNSGDGSQAQLTNIENWFYNPAQSDSFGGWAYLFMRNCIAPPVFHPQPAQCLECSDDGDYWTLVDTYTDLQSFAEYLLLNEIAKDPDGYHRSTFMYRKADTLDKDKNLVKGRIYGGPLWDKNKSYFLGTYGGSFDSTEGWSFTTANCGQAPWWWYVLSQHDGFQTFVSTVWKSAYTTDTSGAFSFDRIKSFVAAQENLLLGTGMYQRDQQRWHAIDPTTSKENLKSLVNKMLAKIGQRLIWMNNNYNDLKSAVSNDCN